MADEKHAETGVASLASRGHLDLRLPDDFSSVGVRSGNPESFGLRRPNGNAAAVSSSPLSDTASMTLRSPGGVQEFAQRFRREGLPLARLWENHSALVSLGLNSKGKPGLWLVQKTH